MTGRAIGLSPFQKISLNSNGFKYYEDNFYPGQEFVLIEIVPFSSGYVIKQEFHSLAG